MKIIILDDVKFNKKLMDSGDTLKEAKNTGAYAEGSKAYFRSSRDVDKFMTEIIHEGTHVLDELEIESLIKQGKTEADILRQFGDNWSFEKRAYFHERSFIKSAFDLKDSEIFSVEDFLFHIITEYPQNL
ncbi:hypothetical protein [uncultured Lacinutrix sp.]|uniref:hypothetical protein n=1 Tax=uncultured Lacinutrix sp. TaxID=574032 RepID=UPI002631ACEA|nr:hypothetical protein [uncultured Lacinutrix sp.]